MVYFVQRGENGPIKVGFVAANRSMERRLIELQVGSAEPLYLLAALPRAGRQTEKKIHAALASDRMQGEWFENSSTIRKLIRVYQERPDLVGLPESARIGLQGEPPSESMLRKTAATRPWDSVPAANEVKPKVQRKKLPRTNRAQWNRAKRIKMERDLESGDLTISKAGD